MPITVLLLAKDLLTREAITYALEKRDYVVVPVGTTKAAYSSFDGILFDAIVAIEAIDDPDIAHVAHDAKAYQRRVKVILVGGHKATGTADFPIDFFVQKPYSLMQIDQAIKKLTGGVDGKHGNVTF